MKLKNAKFKKIQTFAIISLLVFSLFGCTATQTSDNTNLSSETENIEPPASSSVESTSIEISPALDTSDLFSKRDLSQSPDLSDAKYITLQSNNDVNISEEGIYVITGNVENSTIKIDADDESKIQIILDNANIVNEDSPAIYVKSADKVFVTTTDSTNNLEVSGAYVADGDINLDAVIFSKSDITLNGTGSINIISVEGNGISGKDDLKITGGTYSITSAKDSIEANDSIRIYDGEINIKTDKDGIHSENDDDIDSGYVYIQGGTINIEAGDDAIYGNSIIQIDGGTINIPTSVEGIESTYIQINGGNIDVYATDDGINAAQKSNGTILIEVNGGNINVEVGSGDTDGFDSNGDIYINGGTISVTARSAFDPSGKAVLNGGTVTVNGEVVTEIGESMMGPGGGGNHRRPTDGAMEGPMNGEERPEKPNRDDFPNDGVPMEQPEQNQ